MPEPTSIWKLDDVNRPRCVTPRDRHGPVWRRMLDVTSAHVIGNWGYPQFPEVEVSGTKHLVGLEHPLYLNNID